MTALPELLESLSGISVLVIGDLMLDHYVQGDVRRLAPEGPVPVLAATEDSYVLGGAGGVLANIAGLGARPRILGLVARDHAGEKIREIIRSYGVDDQLLTVVDDRPSIVKMRFMNGPIQLLRTDYEKIAPLSAVAEKDLTGKLAAAIKGCGAVILSDYGKGVLTPAVIAAAIKEAKARNIPVLVDPKGKDFTIYKGADFITPNATELAEATGMAVGSEDEIARAARALITQTGIANILAKRSEKGMCVITNQTLVSLPATAREVRGVAGAGDTVIATFASALAAGASAETAADLANQAAGIVVAQTGTTPITKLALADNLSSASIHDEGAAFISPVHHDWAAARRLVESWKAQGLKVGFTNGCFDIVHYGHVNYMSRARARCDRLVVGLNADSSITRLKGPGRPVHEELSRGAVMAALGSVDMVVIFGEDLADDDKPCRVIEALQPDVCFKGGDYKVEDLPEAKVVFAYGGEFEIMPLYEGHSTTSAIQKMQKAV
ncbi:MAG: PfkB family carbohydrate kinase [Micavibrio sp.]